MKVLMISHDADIDGMGPIVIESYIHNWPDDQIDYVLVNYKNIDEKINKLHDSGELAAYNKVVITDVCPSRATLESLDKDPTLEGKLELYDHHRSSLENRDIPWVDIRETLFNDSYRTSATELYYTHVVNDVESLRPYKITDSLRQFVLATRASDVWDKADDFFGLGDNLAELFNQIGAQEYINRMIDRINKRGDFELTDEDVSDIVKRLKAIDNACVKAYKTMNIVDVDGTRVAVCDIEYSYRNNFSQYLRDHNVQADIMAIADFNRGSMSYRTLSEKGDCNEFAKRFGGGGNPAAAGSPITDELIERFGLTVPNKD